MNIIGVSRDSMLVVVTVYGKRIAPRQLDKTATAAHWCTLLVTQISSSSSYTATNIYNMFCPKEKE
jgi:hypothetical protein